MQHIAQHPSTPLDERTVMWLVAAVQFVNILDFVIIMPMGPDFARALAISESRLGYIAGAYTAAAAITGLVGSFFLDRFDRRSALLVSLIGLVSGTAAGGLATGFSSLMAARVLAGAFGGPATSVSLAIIADVIPPERRGQAMGFVMGAFGAASVLGVPLGLWLARVISWQAPFLMVAALGVLMVGLAARLLPPLRLHLAGTRQTPRYRELLGDPLVLTSYAMTATVMMSGFILIPNISAFMQNNLGLPRRDLEWLYLVGGLVSVIVVPFSGRCVDRVGSLVVGTLGTTLLVVIVYLGFYAPSPASPVHLLFISFFLAMGPRNVAYNTLTSKVPAPRLRARFMSLQSATQHASSAGAGALSAHMLSGRPGEPLVGMPQVALVTMCLAAVLPLLLGVVERGVKRRAQRAAER